MIQKFKNLLSRPKPPPEDSYSPEIRRYEEFFKPLGKDSPNQWIKKSTEIYGWLFPGEHELLWNLGLSSPPGDILEIGSWMGKSACILAGTCIERRDSSKLLCIDPFDMQGTDWQKEFHRRLTGSSATTFDSFIANAKRLGFYDEVVPIAQLSQNALPFVKSPLRLAFLDGWHDYDHVRMEFAYVSKLVVPGGFVALHDSSDDFPGVKRFAGELTNADGWESFPSTGTIAVFRKK